MQIRCPHCNQVLNAPDDATVEQGKCPHCGELVNLAEAERIGIGTGDVLGDFRVDRLIGRGGMATVYRGTQVSLDRPVAVKVLASQLAKRPHFVERFHREAKVLAQLNHHNIVSVLAAGEHDDTYYLVMECVEGESLRARLTRDGKIPFTEAAGLIDGVAAGLEYAHNHDVLHRDIKPGNILITAEGVPKIVDFGIARLAGADEAAHQRLTMARTQMGSAHYMAPEQMHDAAAADHRADIYALGVMFYEMLTGELPIGHFAPASKCSHTVPMAVDRILRQCLAAKPDDRIQTAAQFRALVQRLSLIGQPTRIQEGAGAHAHRRHHPQPKKSALPMVLGGVGLLVVAVIAFFALRGGEPEPQAKQPPPKKKIVTPEKPEGPTEAEKREAAAQKLYADAARSLESGDAATAKRQLAQLDQDYGKTAWHEKNGAAVARLRAAIEAKLAPPKPPETKTQERTDLVEEAARRGLEPGLVMAVYDNSTPPRFHAATVVPNVLFDWQTRAPMDGAPANFHTRFAGWLGVQTAGHYEFRFWCDDGARLYLDGKLVLDAWSWGAHKAARGNVHLDAGWHRLWVEHRDKASMAGVKLRWTTPEGDSGGIDSRFYRCDAQLLARARGNPAEDPLAGMSATGVPAAPPDAAGDWVSLFDGTSLGGWEPLRGPGSHAKPGRVHVQGGQLVMEKGDPRTAIVWKDEFPTDSYEMAFDAMRIGGRDFLSLVFPVGESHGSLDVGMWGGGVLSLSSVDGREGKDNLTMKPCAFKDGQWYGVRLRVAPEAVTAWIDGKQAIHVPRADHTIGLMYTFRFLKPLGITSVTGKVSLRNIRMRRLDAAPPIADEGEWTSLFDGKSMAGWEIPRGGHFIGEVAARVSVADGAIAIGAAHEATGVVCTQDMPRMDYDLSFDTMCTKGIDLMGSPVFPLGDAFSQLSIRRKNGFTISQDKDSPRKIGPWPYRIELNRWYNVQIQVRPDRLTVLFDGRTLIDESTEGVRFGIWSGYDPAKPLGFLTCYSTAAKLRNIRLRRLDAAPPPAPGTWTVYTEWPFDALAAKQRQAETAKALGVPVERNVDLGGGVKLDLVLVPAGEFLMGTPTKPSAEELARLHAGQAEEYQREMPQHRVRISRPFWLGKVEVTQAQWQAVMGANPSKHISSRNPVEQVSWDDCQGFLGRLSEKAGESGFCLPTEAQWEYACRAGTATRYSFGDAKEQLDDYAWWAENSGKQSHPVGTAKPNPWGFYDLHGNVWEWCQDGFGDYAPDPQTDPTGVQGARNRPLRGGSWSRPAYHCSSPYRNNTMPGRKYDHVGLRVCIPLSSRLLQAARKQAIENDPARRYAHGVALLKPLWQKRQYAEALAKAKEQGDAGLIEDAEALAGLWEAVRAGAAKLKPGDPFRIRGMAGKVTKVEDDTIHAKAGPVELGMKLTQLDDAAFVALARRGRALTSGRDLLALALLEVHAEKPSPAGIEAALARAAKAGVDTTRHQALLTGETETPAPAAAWGEPFGAVGQKVDQASPGTGHFAQVWRILAEYPAGSQYRVRVQHAAPGDKGAFRIWAWADTTGDGVPDAKIGTSKVLRAKRAGDWSDWEFQTQHTRVFVGNWFVPGTLIYYQGGGSLYTGLDSPVYYSRTVGGTPTSKSPGPRFTNIQVQVKPPAAKTGKTEAPTPPQPATNPEPAGGADGTVTLTVAAEIEGTTDLVIAPSGILWDHVRGERPGTAPESVKAAKATVVNGADWFPRWSVNRSDGHRVRGLPKSLALCDVAVEKVDGRGQVVLLSVESERVVVRFKDRASGTAPHTGRITLTAIGILDLEKAFDAGLRAIELDNAAGAKVALDRVEALRGQAAPGVLDAGYAEVMTRALAQAKTAEWTRLGRTLRFAEAARPGSRDVAALKAWLKTASRPVFADDFDRASLGAWQPERGNWSIENGRLRSKMGPHNAQVFLKGKTFKDYVLTFEMESPDGPFRMGVLFRYTPTRFIQCVMAGCYGLVYIGGCSGMGRGPGGKAEDITVRYTFKTWSRSGGREYEFNRRKPYRMAIRCEGTAYACFVDGQQLAVGRDEKPDASAIGFHLHGGTATFDNVRVYRPVPLPTLEFQPPKP